MKNKLSAAIATEAPPDVVNLTPEFMASFAKQQALLSLDDKVPAALQQRYLPNLWQANRLTTCDGQNCTESTVGIPWYLTTQITIYNSALLEQAGLQSPPATYTELANVAQQVKQETGKYAFFVSFAPQDFLSVLQSMTQMGVQWLNADGTAAFNTPEGQAAFQYWIDLYQQDLLPETALTQGYQEAIEMYQAGKLAILSTGPQFFKALDQDAPEIAEVSKVAPQIIGERGQTVVAMMNIVIPQTTDTPDQSLEFALFMTNPENQLSFAQAADVLPSTVTTLSEQHFQDVQLVDSEKSEPIDQARRISASQVQQAVGLIPPISNIQQLQKIISTQLQMALLNQKSIEQSLTDAEQEWNQTLDWSLAHKLFCLLQSLLIFAV